MQVEFECGQLRKRVTIQTLRDLPRDSFNEEVQAGDDKWKDLATVWASIEPASGREIVEAGMTRADVSHKITIRYFDGLTPMMRFFKAGTPKRVFNIVRILNVTERNRKMEVECKEEIPKVG